MSHKPSWIEVSKGDCDNCNGWGVTIAPDSWMTKQQLIDAGYECRSCDGTGQRSVGYMDLRDASGR